MKSKNFLMWCSMFGFMLVAMAISASAQSTNQSNPTALTAAEFIGKPPTKETNYFFSFSGGPGEVTVRLEIKAKQYSTFARLEILDAELNTLATHNMNAATTSGSQQVLKKINLDEKQTVLLKTTLDGNLANYKIVLGGAVDIGSVGSSPETNSGPESGGSTGDAGTISNTDDVSVSNTTSEPGAEASSNPSGKNKFFNIDLGKFKLGQFVNLPKSGMLVLVMKDGTTQEIDLMSVKSVTIKKN